MKNTLYHAMKLYSLEARQAQKLRIDYILTDDKQEKQALKVAILTLENKI